MFSWSANIGFSIYLVSFWNNRGETLYMISTSSKGSCVSLVSVVSAVHLHCQNILKNYKMGNCLSKCANKPFTRYPLALTSGHLKKAVIDIQKNHLHKDIQDV